MSAHTPGPWEFEDAKREGLTIYGKSQDGDMLVVCSRRFHPYREREMLANFALLRAAPELLEALEVANAMIDPEMGVCPMGRQEASALIAAAIAKAKGLPAADTTE